MMNYYSKICIFLIYFSTGSVFSQDKASFFADTVYMHGDWRNDPYSGFLQWTIQGKTFSWGETIQVNPTPNQIDTIFFKRSPEEKTDTIICDIKEARSYKFIYNECCGSFNVLSNDKQKISGEISFELSEEVADSAVAGTIAETGAYVKGAKTGILRSICSSAMASNISPVVLGEITHCDEINDCPGWMCDYVEEGAEDSYSDETGFKKMYFHFLYMPLNNSPLQIKYNLKTAELSFEYD